MYSYKPCARLILYSSFSVCSKQKRNLHSKKSFRWVGNKEDWEFVETSILKIKSKIGVLKYSVVTGENNVDTVTHVPLGNN